MLFPLHSKWRAIQDSTGRDRWNKKGKNKTPSNTPSLKFHQDNSCKLYLKLNWIWTPRKLIAEKLLSVEQESGRNLQGRKGEAEAPVAKLQEVYPDLSCVRKIPRSLDPSSNEENWNYRRRGLWHTKPRRGPSGFGGRVHQRCPRQCINNKEPRPPRMGLAPNGGERQKMNRQGEEAKKHEYANLSFNKSSIIGCLCEPLI